jgi:peptidyl-prolyl cis-trans isomerase A (cyclophilin A)
MSKFMRGILVLGVLTVTGCDSGTAGTTNRGHTTNTTEAAGTTNTTEAAGTTNTTEAAGTTNTTEATDTTNTTEAAGTTNTTEATDTTEDSGPDEDTTEAADPEGTLHRVTVTTTLGEFVIELNDEAAPLTVANFLTYVDEGFYDGQDGLQKTTFHRVISGFMVQGGGVMTNGQQKALTHASVAHEGPNGLMNLRGTVAMARTADPNSATSQFFVNHVNNPGLDYVSASEPGYLVFGNVVSGLETIDVIAATETDSADVPVTQVVIEGVERLSD